MATRPDDNSAESPQRQGSFPRAVRELDDPLLMLDEVQERWHLSERQIRKAVLDGRLRRVRREGYQPYYPLSSVLACFGASDGQPQGPAKLSRSDNGRNQQSFDLDELAAA